MASYFVILHPRIGGKAAASVAAHVQLPLIGLGLGLIAVHFLAEPIGVWWSYAVGLTIGMSWNGGLWLVRNWRAKKPLSQ
jgi:Na+-driven multidrug efflux pump